MIIVDRMLVGGIRFVLDKLVAAVDAEMNDEGGLREELLAAQMRLELGELTEEEFTALEKSVLGRLREIQERKREGAAGPGDEGVKVTGATAEYLGEE